MSSSEILLPLNFVLLILFRLRACTHTSSGPIGFSQRHFRWGFSTARGTDFHVFCFALRLFDDYGRKTLAMSSSCGVNSAGGGVSDMEDLEQRFGDRMDVAINQRMNAMMTRLSSMLQGASIDGGDSRI